MDERGFTTGDVWRFELAHAAKAAAVRQFLFCTLWGVIMLLAMGIGGLESPGSAESCGRCHRAIHKTWKASTHAQSMESRLFQDLVDYERILPRVWGILGWNIYLYHAHLIVTPPSGQPRDDKSFGWHQDSGRVNVEMESHPRPRLSR